jgi:hypothetical protein
MRRYTDGFNFVKKKSSRHLLGGPERYVLVRLPPNQLPVNSGDCGRDDARVHERWRDSSDVA